MEGAPCSCVICARSDPGRDADIVATVRHHGWSVLRIFGGLEFAYTVGLWHTFRRPELVMFGLQGEDMQRWLNLCVDVTRGRGLPASDEPLEGVIDGFPVCLRAVHDSWYEPLFGTARRFYRRAAVPGTALAAA